MHTPFPLQLHALRRILLIAGLGILAALALIRPAYAEIIDISCWPGSALSLSNAIQQANASPEPDTLRISTNCDIQLISSADYGNGPVALPRITGDLTILGNGATLRRSSTDEFRLLETGPGAHLTLVGITLKGGVAGRGGALYAGGPVTITQSILQDNKATGEAAHGGALYAESSVYISDTTFMSNTSTYSGGALHATGPLTIAGHSVFLRNNGPIYGGAVSADAAVQLQGGYFEYNRASEEGGAVYSKGPLHVYQGQYAHNRAGQSGGALAALGALTMESTLLHNNGAGQYGGAIAVQGEATIHNSVFNRNEASGGWGDIEGGGAIYAKGTLTLDLVFFAGNATEFDGGAVYAAGPLDVVNSSFSANAGEFGGAVYVEGSVQVSATNFISNTGYYGGALYTRSLARVQSATFSQNQAWHGGAIYAIEGEVLISDSHFTANKATDEEGWGGAVLLLDGQILNSSFEDNVASAIGGGVFAGRHIQVERSRFVRNVAKEGGGLAALQIEAPATVLLNNLWIDNQANGGAAFALGNNVSQSGGSIAALHNTIVRTTPPATGDGSAILLRAGALKLHSNIISGHSSGLAVTGGTAAADYNLIHNVTTAYIGTDVGEHDLFADPLFVQPDQGDFRLALGSPAIDSAADNGPQVDYLGTPRPQGAGFDRGAFERTPTPIEGLALEYSEPAKAGQTVYFSATVTAGEAISYTWDFGDGSQATGPYVQHVYGAAGSYEVRVTAENSVSQEEAVATVVVDAPDDGPGTDNPGNDNPGNDNPGNDNPDDDNPGNSQGGDTPGGNDPGDTPGNNDPNSDDPDDNPSNNDPNGSDPDDNQGQSPLFQLRLPLLIR